MPALHELYANHENDVLELKHQGEEGQAINGFLQENFQGSLEQILGNGREGVELFLVADWEKDHHCYQLLMLHYPENLSRYLEGRTEEAPHIAQRLGLHQGQRECRRLKAESAIKAWEKLGGSS